MEIYFVQHWRPKSSIQQTQCLVLACWLFPRWHLLLHPHMEKGERWDQRTFSDPRALWRQQLLPAEESPLTGPLSNINFAGTDPFRPLQIPRITSLQALRGWVLLCSWLSPVRVRARSFYGRCWEFPPSPRGFCGWHPGEMCTGLNYSLPSSWLHHTTGLSRRSHRALVKEGDPTQTQLVRTTVKSIHRKYQAQLLPLSAGCHSLVPGKDVTLLFCPWSDYQDSPPSYFCTLLALESCIWWKCLMGLSQAGCLPGSLEREWLSFCGGRWGWFWDSQ